MASDFDVVCSKIDEEAEILNAVSQELWRNPELAFKEVQAHALLTSTLENFGFEVERHYFLDTAFKVEYRSKEAVGEKFPGPKIAILLEYDALPDIGHACGHNLIAEAGLAAAIAVKAVMDSDPSMPGKVVVMGTPAEENGGGKIRLLEKGAFEDIDAALMVHPMVKNCASPKGFCSLRGDVEYIGKEAHAAFPWEGVNALDAAVMCYNNISVLRQQISPENRIHVIITEGGVKTNVIPGKARLQVGIRAKTVPQVQELRSRIEMCINGAATATGCEVNFQSEEYNYYKNGRRNEVLANVFKEHCVKLGLTFDKGPGFRSAGASDMGNVMHVVPGIHPLYAIPSKGINHTREFAAAAGLPTAQEPTLAAAKAMAMTAVSLFRNPGLLEEVKAEFEVAAKNETNRYQ